jgi:hypothetical protein
MKNEKILPIVDARYDLSKLGKTQKDHKKHFNHDKIYPQLSILDVFLASWIFQGGRFESALIGLLSIIDPEHFSALTR